jgi:signal peptidase I
MCRGESLLRDESVGGASADVEAKTELESGTMAAASEKAGDGGVDGPEPVEPAQGSGLAAWLRDVLVSVAVSAFIITFLYQPVKVEGTSMLPMLQNEDRLFINKMAYRVGEIHRGDVVVFLYPHDHTKSYIKRVIAVGGDDLRIDHGQVYVNGRALKESYVPLRFTDDRSQPDMVIPAHEYFMMGDHRSISSDSRDFGPVEGDLIYGKAAFVYWPLEQIGVVR